MPARLRTALAFVLLLAAGAAGAQTVEPVMALARKEKPLLLDTLKDLVSIESGSRDIEGLDKLSELIAKRLRALGGEVQFVDANKDVYKMFDTPPKIGRMVQATFRGKGTKKILLIAHMDTVYLIGMGAKQPFKIEGNRPTVSGLPTTSRASRSSCIPSQ